MTRTKRLYLLIFISLIVSFPHITNFWIMFGLMVVLIISGYEFIFGEE